MRARFPKDGGGRIIDRLIEYADRTGVDFERNPVPIVEASTPQCSTESNTALSDAGSGYIVEVEEKDSSVVSQLLVGLALSALLLWLVH